MEILNLPIHIIVAMWFIQRQKNKKGGEINVVQHLTGQIGNLKAVLRTENPLRERGGIENWCRELVEDYEKLLTQERYALSDIGVSSVGFVSKGVENEEKDH